MSCECETYIVKCIPTNPCTAGTLLDILADETGTWTGRLEFNGAWKFFGLEVEDGIEISILTTLLNENYVHELKLYKEDGSLFNCYKLHTQYTANVANAPVPPVAAGQWDWVCLTANGNTLTSAYLSGEIAPILYMGSGGDINWSENGITHDAATETLDLTAIGGFIGEICLQYRNLA